MLSCKNLFYLAIQFDTIGHDRGFSLRFSLLGHGSSSSQNGKIIAFYVTDLFK